MLQMDTSTTNSDEPVNGHTPRTFSIVVCNHDQAAFLKESVRSALDQDVRCQVIVVDDGSTDASRSLLETMASQEPRLEVALQPNGGQTSAYNTGFERASGDCVLFLDADDVLESGALRSVAALFADDVVKVHFPLSLIDAEGRPIGGVVPGGLARGEVRDSLVRHGLLYPSPPGSGNVYRRSTLQRLFPLPVDSTDKVGADFFTIYGVVAFGRVETHDGALGRYRLHRQAAGGAANDDVLAFGNAAKGNQESLKVAARYGRLRDHLQRRTGGTVVYAPRLLDFSVMKSDFAIGVLDHPYWSAWRHSAGALARLLRSIWLQPASSARRRLQQSTWAFSMLLAPRPLAVRLARYACDPGSRAGTGA